MIELNKIYQMDNLELMKQIEDNYIDLIYCDILYNTGKKFTDYDDNLGTPQQAIEWYKPRLIEMKRILKCTGNIFLQCDYRLVHYLKVEMDVIFGTNSFRNDIIWSYKRWTASSNKKLQSMHDNILFYAKENNEINNLYEKLEKPKKQNKNDGKGKSLKDEKGNVVYHIQTQREIDDVWIIPILNPKANERVGYATQKPKELLKRIISLGSNEGDVIADFFCGSGTSLVVAKELGRHYIGCDISEKAVRITNERLHNVI
ncbi:site-specific DNA-methyltransferase [Butyricicoccus sp. 1XD8-22]|nr:site-specific DNA-methyltransferase [Butyricicoccus sp. 1XD8-22]